MKKILSVLLSLIAGICFSYAFDAPTQPTGYVNDYANVLNIEQKEQLEQALVSFEASTTNEIAVVIIPDLGGDTVEHYATKLFEKWKIGKEKQDNGILFLVSINDREMRIEVGYGLEGAVPDSLAGRILDSEVIPSFKSGDYPQGIRNGVDAIMEATKGEYVNSEQGGNNAGFPIEATAFLVIFALQIFSFLGSILARSKSWWLGGMLGGIGGGTLIALNVFNLSFLSGGLLTIVLVALGLFYDYVVSKAYKNAVSTQKSIPWWAGGGRSSGGGRSGVSFGGFGGGSSGGGGSSRSW